jgi:CRISPR-associated protein Csd2
MTEVWQDPERRHDFKLIFDVTDGNPNGDPDAGNLPRVDPETMQGLVTDVAIKRKVRNWVSATRDNVAPWRIYIQNRGAALNTLHQEAYDASGLKSAGAKQKREEVDTARTWMCQQFYDIRTFGAVMTTGVNCGQVRGPVQIGMARSVDPVTTLDLSITRVAVTREEDTKVTLSDEGQGEGGKQTEMGRKALIPYGLYVAVGAISPLFGRQTGFSSEDLALFWEALTHAWDLDRSAARGVMTCRGVYIFTHTSPYGDAPAHTLLERVRVSGVDGVEARRAFSDYTVSVESESLPEGIITTRLE